MSREVHVRFRERAAGKLRRATRPVAESFFHTLKVELVHDQRFRTRREATAAVFEYMEVFYDRQRIHSTLRGLTPAEFEDLALRRRA